MTSGLALAVINDGITYGDRVRRMFTLSREDYLQYLDSIVKQECRKPVYEGQKFTEQELKTACEEILEHSLNEAQDQIDFLRTKG